MYHERTCVIDPLDFKQNTANVTGIHNVDDNINRTPITVDHSGYSYVLPYFNGLNCVTLKIKMP